MSYWKTLEGKTLNDRYHLIRLVGLGGFGAVYEADDLEFDDRVAVKVVHTEFARRVRREGMLGRKFNHRNAVRIENVYVDSDPPFIVMEFIDGKSLEELGRLSDSQIRTFIRQVGSALHKAHEQKLVHRDLKPQNILLTQDDSTGEDRFVILDFGIASQLGAGDTLRAATMDGAGTPEYMAPEQIRGEEPTPKSDIYSFGVLLYRLLTGRVPFPCDHKSLVTYFSYVDQNAPPRFREVVPESSIDPLIEAIVLRCLSKSPNGRPDSMQEIIDYFENATPPADEDADESQAPAADPSVLAGGDGPADSSPAVDNEAIAEAPTEVPAASPDAPTDDASSEDSPSPISRRESPPGEPVFRWPDSEPSEAVAEPEPEIASPREVASTLAPGDILGSDLPPEYQDAASQHDRTKAREDGGTQTPAASETSEGNRTIGPAGWGGATLQPESDGAATSSRDPASNWPSAPPRGPDTSAPQSEPVTPPEEVVNSSHATPEASHQPGAFSTLAPPAGDFGDHAQTFTPGGFFSEADALETPAGATPLDDADDHQNTGAAADSGAVPLGTHKPKGPLGPKLAAVGVLACIAAAIFAYPYVQRARIQAAVDQFVQAGQYDQARARVEAADPVTRLVLKTKSLVQKIHAAGVSQAEELVAGGKLEEAIAESRNVLAAFPDDPDVGRILEGIADGVRSRIQARTENGDYEGAVRSIRQDPIVQQLAAPEVGLLVPQDLERAIRNAGVERLRELSRQEQHKAAFELGRSLSFGFPTDEELGRLVRAEEILVTTAEGTALIRDGEFERGIQRLSVALDKQPELQQRQGLLLTRARARKDWAKAGAAGGEAKPDVLARLNAALADIIAVEQLGSTPGAAMELRADIALHRAQLKYSDNPLGAICDYQTALTGAASRAEAEKSLLQIAELYGVQGHQQFEAGRLDYDPQAPGSADEKLQAAIDNLGIALLALPNPELGLDEYFARGLARTMLGKPDYVGAARDLERFQEMARKRLQDPSLSDSARRADLRYKHASALSKLAWLRATSPDAVAELRDGETALRYAEEAAKIFEALYAESRDDAFLPELHSALTAQAAALAEAKDFNRAIRITKGVMVNYNPDTPQWKMHNTTIEEYYKHQRPFRDQRPPSKSREPKPCPTDESVPQ